MKKSIEKKFYKLDDCASFNADNTMMKVKLPKAMEIGDSIEVVLSEQSSYGFESFAFKFIVAKDKRFEGNNSFVFLPLYYHGVEQYNEKGYYLVCSIAIGSDDRKVIQVSQYQANGELIAFNYPSTNYVGNFIIENVGEPNAYIL